MKRLNSLLATGTLVAFAGCADVTEAPRHSPEHRVSIGAVEGASDASTSESRARQAVSRTGSFSGARVELRPDVNPETQCKTDDHGDVVPAEVSNATDPVFPRTTRRGAAEGLGPPILPSDGLPARYSPQTSLTTLQAAFVAAGCADDARQSPGCETHPYVTRGRESRAPTEIVGLRRAR